MAIEYPIKKSLGADVHNFPKVQYDKIKEIIDALNTAQEDIVTITPTYQVYTALLNQSGTDAPVATILENTLGATIVWARTLAGNYTGIISGNFTSAETFVTANVNAYGFRTLCYEDSGIINILTESAAVTPGDDLLINYPVEIRVYNS